MMARHPLPAAHAAGRRPALLIIATCLWIAALANAPLWGELRALSVLDSAAGWGLAAALGVVIAAVLMAVLSLLAWRWTLKPALTLVLFMAAFGAYFMLSYHVVIDATMMLNVLQTDAHEATALLGPRLAATLLLLAVLPAVVIWRTPVRYGRWPRRLAHNLLLALAACVLLLAAVLASFQPLSSTLRNHKQVRYLLNPLNSVYALGYLATGPLRRDESVVEPIGLDAHVAVPVALAGARPPLLVLVLGETGRSGNFGLNGYERPTTPRLARENVVSFRNAWSCGTSTAASLPCMFSHLGREGFEARKHNFEGLLDVVRHAGMAVLWLDNQSGCKGVCARVPHATTTGLEHPQLCAGGACQDGILLEGLDERLAALPAGQRERGVVLVLHPMGSHGPAYWQRSPDAVKRFLPECRSNNLQDCGRASLVNAYDNSIVYTDHVLASTIAWLKSREAAYDTAMVYVADHGESLGENNLYLHGLPYAIAPDVQKRVPWITWLSPRYEQRSAVTTECLQGKRDAALSHDNYFHSVLGLLGIQTRVYQRRLDVYAPCASL